MNYTPKVRRAIARYTFEGCLRAYAMYRQGYGASGIALAADIPNVNTTNAADAAINAGRDIVAHDVAHGTLAFDPYTPA